MAGGGGATIICFSTIFLARRWIHFSKKFPWQTKVLSIPVKRIDSILLNQISLLKKAEKIWKCFLRRNQTWNFADLLGKDKSTHKSLLIHNSYSIAPQICLPPFVLCIYDFLVSKQVLKRINYYRGWRISLNFNLKVCQSNVVQYLDQVISKKDQILFHPKWIDLCRVAV